MGRKNGYDQPKRAPALSPAKKRKAKAESFGKKAKVKAELLPKGAKRLKNS